MYCVPNKRVKFTHEFFRVNTVKNLSNEIKNYSIAQPLLQHIMINYLNIFYILYIKFELYTVRFRVDNNIIIVVIIELFIIVSDNKQFENKSVQCIGLKNKNEALYTGHNANKKYNNYLLSNLFKQQDNVRISLVMNGKLL